jgi:hypothetical protein
VRLNARSSLPEVVACVARALADAKIRAVLTGGACATLYSRGEYQSSDLDFILQSAVTTGQLDAVMESIGFFREGNRYRHPRNPFFVEFPGGLSASVTRSISDRSSTGSVASTSGPYRRRIHAVTALRLSTIGMIGKA